MPTGNHDHLDSMYAKQRLLIEEAGRLEQARDLLEPGGENADRRYILDLQITALREESSRIEARISDVLERDLQR
jgi:uncharacterized protein involved in exopolysaccharide biosynthesis